VRIQAPSKTLARQGRARKKLVTEMSDKVNRSARVVAAFGERWPLCFPHERPFVPLKVGIHADIIAAGGFTEADVKRGLAWYVHRSRYISAVIKGGGRIDLDGNIVGQITEAEREHAAQLLAARSAGFKKIDTHAEKEAEVKAAEVAVNAEQCSASATAQKAAQPKRLSLRDLKAAAIARRAGSLGAA
jgi:sRNA-binding protein